MTTNKITLTLLFSAILLGACNSGGSTNKSSSHVTEVKQHAKTIVSKDLKLREIQSIAQLKSATTQTVYNIDEFGISEIKERHDPKGLLENYAHVDLTGFKVSLFSSQIFGKVSQEKDLFMHEPLIEDIYQNRSLDCGFLAALSTVLATENGATFLEEKLKETTATTVDQYRKVYVQLYDSNLQPKLVELEKERDWSMVSKQDDKLYPYSATGWYYDLTSSAKLWVHLFERAYKRLYTPDNMIDSSTGFPKKTVMRAVDGGDALSALTGLPTVSNHTTMQSPSEFIKHHDGNPMVFNINIAEVYFPQYQDYFIINNKSVAHYYAIVSKIVTINAKEGVWVYNTLQANAGLDYIRAYLWNDDKKSFFFMPLENLNIEAHNVIAIDMSVPASLK